MAPSFISHVPYDGEHPRMLAIYCSDGRFTTAVEELAASRGHGSVDTLTLPGGPALFNVTSRYSDRDAVRHSTDFLIRKHGIREVILVAHQGCGYYADRHPRVSAQERERLQVADLREAARAIRRLAPGLWVEAFFARAGAGRIEFEAVELPLRGAAGG